MTESTQVKEPTLRQATIPISFLIALLITSRVLYESDSSYGPNQIILILTSFVAVLIGLKNGYKYKELEESMVHGISLAMGAVFILLIVGSLIGTWILGGIVPTMIYYGLQILNPSFFYVASCIICIVIALGTGSSWTTASTIGVALIGIATALGLSLPMTAGAIISGAYFGDKLSPLSDTTNLAPAMAGTDLFTHIRHMLWTTIPSMILALILFTVLGLKNTGTADTNDVALIVKALEDNFTIGWYLMLAPVIVLVLVMKKVPAFPALLLGSLVGCVFAVLFQQDTVLKFVGDTDLSKPLALLKGCWTVMFDKFTLSSESDKLNDLLSRGGMSSMLNTIWLIVSAMMFGAVMEKVKLLDKLAEAILTMVKSSGSLVFATLSTSLSMNIITSDQYIAIVVPGRMFRAEFEKRGLHPKNLSRALEDAGTLTSPLIPWNTCGAYMAGVLGVPTASYFMFCFFNMANPVISAIYGFTGFTIEKLEQES